MANGSFTDTPGYKKLRKGAKWGQYDEATLADALQGKGMDATAGIGDIYRTRDQALADPLLAGVPEQFRGDVLGAYQQGGDIESYLRGIEGGFTSAITADPNAGDPMSGGMSWQQYQQFFPDQARAYGQSDAYRTAVGTMPSAGNPAAVSDPTPAPTPPPAPSGIDPGMQQLFQSELDKARNLARQGRTDFSLQDASVAAARMGLPSDIEGLRALVMQDFVTPAGAASGPAAQPAVTAVPQDTGTTFQPSGPSADAAEAVGGVTDPVLRGQQMDTVRDLVAGAEEAGAKTREGLPGLQVADPNLDIQLDPAVAPTGGPDLFATDDVQYDPEFFQYETDLGNIYLDALRQSLGGDSGIDPQTASQIADLEARQAKDEAQTTEDLQRLGVLRGGGDTADVLGELRAGYGRTYSDIWSDQAARQQDDPRYQAALDLAGLKSDRYMEGGEMIGRLGGQDTLEARLANQEAIEREADISGFLRGARSLEGRGQDIDAQFGRADRQLEEARLLAPQYGDAADLARSDAILQQDVADRNLARGLTITEPTTRERFEEGVRGAQEAEALSRAGVSGYLDGVDTLARDVDYDLVKELDTEASRQADKDRRLEREIEAGEVTLDGEGQPRTTTIAGQEAGSEERMLRDQLDTDEALARIDAKSRTDIQKLINEGSYDEAEMLMDIERDMQNTKLTFEQQNLFKELKNLVTLGQIDIFGAQDLQEIINKGDLDQAELILDGIEATATATVDVAEKQADAAVDVATQQRYSARDVALLDKQSKQVLANIEKDMQSEVVDAQSADLLATLANGLALGQIDADTAVTIQRSIARGEFSVAQTQLAGVRAQADAAVDVAEAQGTAAVDVAEKQAGAAVDVAKQQRYSARDVAQLDKQSQEVLGNIEKSMQSAQLDAQSKDLLATLANGLALGQLDATTAKSIQRTIARGEFSVAQTQLSGVRAQADAAVDVAEAQADAAVDVAQEQRGSAKDIAEIDKAMASEQLTSEQTNLFEQLKTEVTLGRIDAGSAKSIQNAIIKGDLAESRQQLEYAREIAAGTVTIDGTQVDTIEAGRFNLEEQLTDAQLQQLVKSEQGQSIANLLSLVQTLDPDSQARGDLEAEIAQQIRNTVDDEALEEVLLEMLAPITVGGETGDL